MDKYLDIFENLIKFKDEYEWLDFKENWFSKDEIGEYISAIANGATLSGREYGYVVCTVRLGCFLCFYSFRLLALWLYLVKSFLLCG